MRKAFWAKLVLLLSLIVTVNTEALVEAAEQPSMVVLVESPTTVSADEARKLLAVADGIFGRSKALRPIVVDPSDMFWSTSAQATMYSFQRKADYMLYVSLSKDQGIYSYSAKLLKPGTGALIATFEDSWKGEHAASEKVMFKLASDAIYTSSGKITVNMTIISDPKYSDVYRDTDRLGNTGEKGCFTETYWWDTGSYKIKVSKPDHEDNVETIKVKNNPTDYQREVKLRRKKK